MGVFLLETKQIPKSVVNHKLREAQTAMWNLEETGILTREEIIKVTGMLQGKKYPLEEL